MLPVPFLNLSSSAAPNNGPGPVVAQSIGYSERGLLGLAFHPDFANPLAAGYRKFYINYNKNYVAGGDPEPPQVGDPVNCVTVIAEFQVQAGNPNAADPGSERRLLVFTQPQNNHNGGQLEFGPDGFLYIGCGDGGSADDNNTGHTGGASAVPRPTANLGNGQDKTRLLGKILRIDPLDPDGAGPATYSIPATNPFVGAGGGVREEIYAYGLRNPWRFSFDKRMPNGTNRLFCGDVGQGRIEEINLIVAGGNYGWRYKEGMEFPTFSSGAGTNPMLDPGLGPYIDPIAMYAHPSVVTSPVLPQLGLSVTGGFVYRGAAIPALQGKYIFGDYGSTSGASDGRIMGLEEVAPVGSGVFTLTEAIPFINSTNPIVGQRILCLGEDESGEIYVGLKSNAGVLALAGGLPAGGIYKIVPLQTVNTTLTPSQDNTIFSENPPGPPPAITGYPSDALGYLYVGRTGPNYGPYLRRALVAFDVAAQVPAGTVIQSAQVSMYLNRPGPASEGTSLALHRLNETWGEGTSKNASGQGFGAQATSGDATWVRRFYDTSTWATPGGSFVASASATAPVFGMGTHTWGPTAQLLADVQGWIDAPSSNAGWILVGDEVTDTTSCQFHSKDSFGQAPSLEITYGIAPELTRRESWLQQYFLVGQFVDDLTDLEGDGIVNLLEYAYGLSPLGANPSGTGLQVSSAIEGANTIFTISFRRDPRAVDLTYTLQTSSDLVNWSDIVQVVGGGPPSGSGLLSEGEIAGEEPIILVTAQETFPTFTKRFARLRVVRTPTP